MMFPVAPTNSMALVAQISTQALLFLVELTVKQDPTHTSRLDSLVVCLAVIRASDVGRVLT